MQSERIEVKIVDAAGTIVLNRPQHGNALTRRMVAELGEALDDLYYDRRVRTILLTGAGEAFSVGIDLAESQAAAEQPDAQQQWGDEATELRDVVVRLLEVTKPVIAAVNGPAMSFGATLALTADMVIAAETAEIGLPDARRGLVAGLAAPLLCHRIGSGRAAAMLMTGQLADAQQALQLGLFHELVAGDAVWARGMQIASQCAACAPQALQLTKRLLNETLGEQLATQLSAGAIMQATARTTPAAEEGIAAALEGREPKWD